MYRFSDLLINSQPGGKSCAAHPGRRLGCDLGNRVRKGSFASPGFQDRCRSLRQQERTRQPGQNWLARRFQAVADAEPAPSGETRVRIQRAPRTEPANGSQRAGPAAADRASFPCHGRCDGAVHRPVRHRMGHHAQLQRHRGGQDTSLATVAPGIAEALFATAIGLAAAIPAVLAYNQANVSLSRLAGRLSAAVAAIAKQRAYASYFDDHFANGHRIETAERGLTDWQPRRPVTGHTTPFKPS